MFNIVMELVNGKVKMKGILRMMLFADILAVVVEIKWEMQEGLGEWKEAFGKQG